MPSPRQLTTCDEFSVKFIGRIELRPDAKQVQVENVAFLRYGDAAATTTILNGQHRREQQ